MSALDPDDNVNVLIRDVTEAAKLPPKARLTSIKPTVENLASAAYQSGLLPDALQNLVALVTNTSGNYLDQASLASIVRNLYPASRVSRQIVLRVVASLGHGSLKPSLNIQAALIRWLILVYHVLESPVALSQAYQVLFGLLDTAATRSQLSHLLALITRRKHVKPFRIQALLALSRQSGNDPCLVGLLRVYKDYYPEIIVGEAVRGKASAFKHPDPLWRSRLDEIQDAHLQHTQHVGSGTRDGFRVHRPLNRGQKSKVVPAVHTAHVNENAVTLEEIEDASGLAASIDKLELPNQLVAVLADPVLQKLLLLRPSEDAYQRVVNWLQSVLGDVITGNTPEDTLWDILEVIHEFVKQTQIVPSVLLNFFSQFFEVWDGSGRREVLFSVLAYTPLLDFEVLDKHIFQPFETAVLSHRPDCHLELLVLYTDLLQHWTAILYSSDEVPEYANLAIEAVIRHVEPLAQTLIQISRTELIEATILAFYEQAVRLVADTTLQQHVKIALPPSSLVYLLFFSNSLATVSRLCYVLANYKKGFEAAMSARRQDPQQKGGAVKYSKAQVILYNSYLMDICNCLWRARAFRIEEGKSKGCMVSETTVEALASYVSSVAHGSSLASFFDLSHSPVLSLQSIQQVRELEDEEIEAGTIETRHAGPVTQASLTRLATSGGLDLSWQNYRIGVLKALSEKGHVGVAELLKNTMTVLKNAMEAQEGSK